MEGIQSYLTLGKNWSDKNRRGRVIGGKGLSYKIPLLGANAKWKRKTFDLDTMTTPLHNQLVVSQYLPLGSSLLLSLSLSPPLLHRLLLEYLVLGYAFA